MRFISAEPLLGAVDLSVYLGAIKLTTISAESITETSVRTKQFTRGSSDYDALLRRHDSGVTAESPRLDWVIAGGESGPRARPSHPDWFRSLKQQCDAAGVAFFMKQITASGRTVAFDKWPDDLKVREFPNAMQS